jgi:hypothetical protein
MKTWAFGFVLAMLFASAVGAEQTERIGQIRTLTGSGSIQRNGAALPAAVGVAIHRGDLIRTGKPGALGIVLIDDTTISLGPGSELALTEYAFDPREGKFAMVMRMTKGTFVYLSGLIGKLAPNTIQLQIPDATIAVRGTKLLVEATE